MTTQFPPPPPGPQPHYPVPPPGYPGAAARTNQMAIISLVMGIGSWLVFPLVGAVLAVVFGHMARNQIRVTGEEGASLATAGIWLGWAHLIVIGLVILGIIAIVVVGLVLVATSPH